MTDLYLFPQQDFDVVLRTNAPSGGQSSSGTATVAGGGVVTASGVAVLTPSIRAIRRSLTITHPYIERHYGNATVAGGGVPIVRGAKGASSCAIVGSGGDVLTMARRGPSRSHDEEDLLLLIA